MVSNLPNTSVAEVLPAGAVFESAHAVQKGDPKIDGPYLDDLRAAQEDEYRRQRMKEVSQVRDEDTNKKKDVPFDDFRAASQIQHDENRYHEEKTVEDSVKAHTKKTPKTAVEKAGKEGRALPGTKSKKKAVKKADNFKGKTEGDTPNIKVQQKKAKEVTDREGQPSNETKPHDTAAAQRPEQNTDTKAVKKAPAKKTSTPRQQYPNAKATDKLKSETTRPTDVTQMESKSKIQEKLDAALGKDK
jgi:hypothetical protein